MKHYRYLLLDADGTLFDYDRAESEALKQTLRQQGLPYSESIRTLYREINQSLWLQYEQGLIDKAGLQTERFGRLLQQAGLDGLPDQINAMYLGELGRCAYLIEDAASICRQLSARHHLAIITNGIGGVQHPRIRRSALADIIQEVFVSEEIGFQKPHMAFFDHVMEKLEISDRGEALVIGDSLTADIAGGNDAGLDTCWYNPGHIPPMNSIRPTYEIDALKRLPELLSGKGS